MIAAADLLETATTRTTARTTALTRAYPAVGSEGVANTYAMANRLLTSAFIEATATRRTAARPTVTASLLFSTRNLLSRSDGDRCCFGGRLGEPDNVTRMRDHRHVT